jgi:hypothetical protein
MIRKRADKLKPGDEIQVSNYTYYNVFVSYVYPEFVVIYAKRFSTERTVRWIFDHWELVKIKS